MIFFSNYFYVWLNAQLSFINQLFFMEAQRFLTQCSTIFLDTSFFCFFHLLLSYYPTFNWHTQIFFILLNNSSQLPCDLLLYTDIFLMNTNIFLAMNTTFIYVFQIFLITSKYFTNLSVHNLLVTDNLYLHCQYCLDIIQHFIHIH